jgi:hypothetical protein
MLAQHVPSGARHFLFQWNIINQRAERHVTFLQISKRDHASIGAFPFHFPLGLAISVPKVLLRWDPSIHRMPKIVGTARGVIETEALAIDEHAGNEGRKCDNFSITSETLLCVECDQLTCVIKGQLSIHCGGEGQDEGALTVNQGETCFVGKGGRFHPVSVCLPAFAQATITALHRSHFHHCTLDSCISSNCSALLA